MPRELENIVESIIFASPEGASTKEITRCVRGAVVTAREAHAENADEAITRFADADETQIVAAISHLNAIYDETGRAFRLVERPAGWRIMSRAEFSPWVRELFPDKKPARLTPSALETLAIIAYRQPITKSSIEAVRGVSVDGPVSALMDRNVIRIAGRADLPGRPLLYETTDVFLEHFGIKTVDELPNASELRSVKLPEPEGLTLPTTPQPDPQAELPLESSPSENPENPNPSNSDPTPAPAGGKSKKKSKGKKATAAQAAAEAQAAGTDSTSTSPSSESPDSSPKSTPEPSPVNEWFPPDEPDTDPDADPDHDPDSASNAGQNNTEELDFEAETESHAATASDPNPLASPQDSPDPDPSSDQPRA